jgi:hypothetical protein
VASREQWAAIVAEIRRAPSPRESLAVNDLYALATQDGLAALRTFHDLDGEDPRDLIQDVVAELLADIVNADDPRAFLKVALVRRGIDSSRRRCTADTGAVALLGMASQRQAASGSEAEQVLAIDVWRRFSRLPLLDQDLLLRVGVGESRDDLARERGTTRANIDQKVSRLRRLLQEEP